MKGKYFSPIRSAFVLPPIAAALCAIIAVASLARVAQAQAPYVPIHRYSFANAAGGAPDGSVVADSVGAADGLVRGAGATFTGTRVTIPGGASATAAYIDLPNGLFSANSTNNGGSGQITLEVFAKVTGNRNWGRIFDFGSSGGVEVTGPGGGGNGERYIMLSSQIGTDVNNLRFEMSGASGFPNGQGFTLDFPTAFNQDRHFVMTWDEATGAIKMYQNGVLVVQATRTATMTDIQDVNVWLGRSNWTGDSNMQGEFDEFRIYDRVLPPEQARASFLVGPDTFATGAVRFAIQPTNVLQDETRPISFSTFAVGDLPITYQWYRGTVPITDATNATYSIASVLPADSGAQFRAVASNFVSGTTYFATSQVATLTVLGDTNPPTLLFARVNATNQIELVFSERLHPDAANNTASYGLTGNNAPAIQSAVLSTDGTRVTLTLNGGLLSCESYVVSVTGVRDVSASGHVIAPGTTATFWNYNPAGLTHRYTFNNLSGNAIGATVPDFVNGADGLVKNGTGTPTFTGTRLILSGGSSASAPYVDLPNGLLSASSTNAGGSGAVSIEGWVKVTGVQSWSRIFDFGSTDIDPTAGFLGGEVTGPGGGGEGRDYFFLDAMNGTDTSTRQIDFRNEDPAGGGAWNTAYTVANFNKDFHFVVTWDEASGVIRVYEDGKFVVQTATTVAMSDLHDVNVWLGRSNWVQDNNMQGEFDEFRTYDRILATNEMLVNQIGGADNNFGALLGFNLVLRTNSLVTNTVESIRAFASFSSVGTQDMAIAGCVTYSSTDSNVVYISADGMIHAGNTGTATVTASLAGLVDSEVIEVTADATPPSLLSARANSARLIEITFSEPLDPGTASESGNYTVSGPSGPIVVSAAELQANQSRVVLSLESSMPCEYITVLVSFVADQSPLFNQIAENSPISFFNFIQAGMTHRYTFNNAATATVTDAIVPDGVGTADGVVRGTGATFTGSRVTLPGGSSGSAAYVDLPNGLFSANSTNNSGSGQISLEVFTKVTGNRNWGRIFDFGSSSGAELPGPGGGGNGERYIMLSSSIGTDVDNLRFEMTGASGFPNGQNFTLDFPTSFNQDRHFVMTWDEATGVITMYQNGVLVAQATRTATMTDIQDVNVWLGRSNWTGDSNMQGEFDEFRVYNRVLSPAEIAFNETIGPDNTLGQPQAVRISAPSTAQVGQVITPAVFADFTTVSNVNLTGTTCFTLESSNPLVASVGAAGTFNAVGNGVASLIARLSGLSNSTPVTVSTGGGSGSGLITLQISGGIYTVSFTGTPGVTYRIQRTTDLTTPVQWSTTLTTQMAPPNGIITIQDPNPPAGQAFYRAVSP